MSIRYNVCTLHDVQYSSWITNALPYSNSYSLKISTVFMASSKNRARILRMAIKNRFYF